MIYLTDHKSAVKLTVAYYQMPDGRIIHRTVQNTASDSWGIIPDVEINLREDEVEKIRQSRYSLDLKLFSPDEPTTVTPATVTRAAYHTRKKTETAHEFYYDRQLIEALDLVRTKINQ